MFITALFTIAKTWKQPKCPQRDERIRKLWCTCTMEYYSVAKKSESMPFAGTWMDPEIVTLREVGKRQMLHDFTYMCTQICHKRTYEGTKTDSQMSRLVAAKGWRGGGGMYWEFGISRGKWLYIEWIRKRSSRTAQGTICNILWQTIMEKNLKKECLLFVYLTHFAVHKKWNTTL